MISLLDVKARQDLPPVEDNKTLDLIAAVEDQWVQLTNRSFSTPEAIVETQLMEGYAPKNLYTRVKHVETLTSIRDRYINHRDYGTDSAWVDVSVNDYELIDIVGGHIVRTTGCWRTSVELTYVAGVADTSVPAAVKYALVTQVLHLRQRNANTLLTLKSQNFQGGKGVFHNADFHPIFTSTVKMYREGPNG